MHSVPRLSQRDLRLRHLRHRALCSFSSGGSSLKLPMHERSLRLGRLVRLQSGLGGRTRRVQVLGLRDGVLRFPGCELPRVRSGMHGLRQWKRDLLDVSSGAAGLR